MSDMHTATVNAADFYRAVANAALFASTDDTVPALTTVRLTAGEPGQLLAEATNRYVVSQETIDLIDRDHNTSHPGHDKCAPVTTDLDVLVDAKGLVKITKMLKQLEVSVPGTTDQPLIRIDYTDDEHHAAFTLTRHLNPDQTLRAEVVTVGDFPNISQLWPDLTGEDRTPDFTIAQKWLALFAKVETDGKPQYRPVRFSTARPEKPMQVTIGDRFRAIVVPLRGPA